MSVDVVSTTTRHHHHHHYHHHHRAKSPSSSSSSFVAPVCVFSTCSLCAFLGLVVLDLMRDASTTLLHAIVACLCLSTCALTIVTDPGIVLPSKNNAMMEEGNVEEEEDVKEEEEESANNSTNKRRYCETCKIFKPKRSSHCRTCNVCVRGFDHHCGALNNCIGEKNMLFFVVFIVTEAYLAVTFFWKAYERLHLLGFPFDYHPSLNSNTGGVLATLFMMFICVHGSCMSLFSCFHVVMYAHDLTTKELSDYVKSRGGYREIVASSSAPVSSSSSSFSSHKTVWRLNFLGVLKRVRKACDFSDFRLKSQTMMEVNRIRSLVALEDE